MDKENDSIISYTFNMPKSLRDFFAEIAEAEQRDLSFIVRRVLLKERKEIEEKKKENFNYG